MNEPKTLGAVVKGRPTQPAEDTLAAARTLISDLVEYAQRYVEVCDEPRGGDCQSLIGRAKAFLVPPVGPFYTMLDHDQSTGLFDTLDEARAEVVRLQKEHIDNGFDVDKFFGSIDTENNEFVEDFSVATTNVTTAPRQRG